MLIEVIAYNFFDHVCASLGTSPTLSSCPRQLLSSHTLPSSSVPPPPFPPLISPRNRLRPLKLIQSHTPTEPSKPTLLRAPMRQIRLVVHGHVVDVHGARFDLASDAQAGGEVFGEDCGAEAVFGVVCDGEGGGFGAEGEEGDGGAEGFCAVDFHLGCYGCDNYWSGRG